MLIKKIKNNRAFSLLEVTLAMGVLVIGILGVFSLVIQNAKVQTFNKQYLIASMLAQEGIEIVRNKRDSNWLDDDLDWYEGITDGNNSFSVDYSDPYNFDFSPNDISNSKAQLYLDANHFYTHISTGNVATSFYRLIEIHNFTDNSNPADGEEDSFRVVSTVQWTGQGQTHEYVAETLLYNWRGL